MTNEGWFDFICMSLAIMGAVYLWRLGCPRVGTVKEDPPTGVVQSTIASAEMGQSSRIENRP